MRAPLGYLARNSFILQTGVPKMDIAFYQKFTTYTATPVSYEPTDLSDYGKLIALEPSKSTGLSYP